MHKLLYWANPIDKVIQCTNCYIEPILLNTYIIVVKVTCKPSKTISISPPFVLASPNFGGGNVGENFKNGLKPVYRTLNHVYRTLNPIYGILKPRWRIWIQTQSPIDRIHRESHRRDSESRRRDGIVTILSTGFSVPHMGFSDLQCTASKLFFSQYFIKIFGFNLLQNVNTLFKKLF